MRTPLAWHNLVHQKLRTAVATIGVSFSIVLVFLQLGFFGAVEATATHLFSAVDFDLMIVSTEFLQTNRPGSFPMERLIQARTMEGVIDAAPLYLSFGVWCNPQTRRSRNIMLLACPLGSPVFRSSEVQASVPRLRTPDTVLMDRLSRSEFGPKTAGTEAEVNGRRVTVVGQFTQGGGFAADGVLFSSDETFSRVNHGWPLGRVNMGLVKLEPGSDPIATAAALNRRLPEDVHVWTRSALEARERRYWFENTPTGAIIGFGVGVAFIVGMVFTYQVISSDISNHLHEYATLKAMGYGSVALAQILWEESVILAVAGFFPALAISLGLYALTRAYAAVPIFMTWQRIVFVLVIAVAMSSVSGLIAMRKLRFADPADLY